MTDMTDLEVDETPVFTDSDDVGTSQMDVDLGSINLD
jgi:hypothetical protein